MTDRRHRPQKRPLPESAYPGLVGRDGLGIFVLAACFGVNKIPKLESAVDVFMMITLRLPQHSTSSLQDRVRVPELSPSVGNLHSTSFNVVKLPPTIYTGNLEPAAV